MMRAIAVVRRLSVVVLLMAAGCTSKTTAGADDFEAILPHQDGGNDASVEDASRFNDSITLHVLPAYGSFGDKCQIDVFTQSGRLLTGGTTTSAGVADLQVSSQFEGEWVIAMIHDGAECTYWDEGAQRREPLASDLTVLTRVTPNATTVISPITTIAAEMAGFLLTKGTLSRGSRGFAPEVALAKAQQLFDLAAQTVSFSTSAPALTSSSTVVTEGHFIYGAILAQTSRTLHAQGISLSLLF